MIVEVADLFGVLEVFEKGIRVPGDALVHVCSGVRETIDLARFTAEDSTSQKKHGDELSRRKYNDLGRRTRASWGQLCEDRLLRRCGTERIWS